MKKIQNFQIEVTLEDNLDSAVVRIGVDPSPPDLAALMVATEHMMNAMCMEGTNYEKSLASLCDGARKSKMVMYQGRPPQ